MLERFNFYDIYAYLLPGLTILGLAWLPYLVLGGTLPTGGLSEGLVVVIVAYASGHVLQTFAKELWSSKVSWIGAKREYPTRALLEDQDNVLSLEMKTRLKDHITKHFKIDLAQQGAYEDAWRLCRTALKSRKGGSYVEQFHGIYNFMKGAATAFAYATPYYCGWAISTKWAPDEYMSDVPLWGVIGVALVLALSVSFQRIRPWIWLIAITCIIPAALTVGTYLNCTIESAWKTVLLVVILIMLAHKTMSFIHLFRQRQPAANPSTKVTNCTHAMRLCLAIATFAGGILLGHQTMSKFTLILLLIAGLSWIVAVQCAIAYHFFAREFAAAIYRDYWVVVGRAEPEKKSAAEGDDV